MLDIQFIRDNPEVVKQKSQQKQIDVDIDQLLGFDTKRRELLRQAEDLRRQRNALSEANPGQKPSDEQMAQGRQLKEDLANLEHQLASVEQEFLSLLKTVPNMPLDDVPVGASEADNVVAKEWGTKPQFDFAPQTHWQLAETRGLIDKERAAKVAGSRFAYLKGGLVELQFTVIQWVLRTLSDETIIKQIAERNSLQVSHKPFTPVLPPYMLKTAVYDAMDRLEPRDDRYKVGEAEDDLWLEGSAEHTLGSMHMDEILAAGDLPIRYLGYATSFRREAGSYGKDLEGIIRLHQFDKLEMEVFSAPETGLEEHLLLIAIQEYLMQQLGLSYHLLNKCTADIGKPNARGVDIEVWLPGHGKYVETHTADYMTNYQARRLKARLKRGDGQTELVHTNDATAFALGRTLVAIIENYQTKEGHIRVPDVLKPFMGGREVI